VTFITEAECCKGQADVCLCSSVMHLFHVEVTNEEGKHSRNILPLLLSFLQRHKVTGKVDQLLPLICTGKGTAVSTVTGLEWPRGFQEVKVPRFHDNGTGWL
jgi:hypothetical protein